MYTQEFIELVKKATDMVKLAKKYTELVPAGGGIWQGKCPHPKHKDLDPSFRVWEKSQSWACMGCHNGKKNSKDKNYGSDCFSFIQWMSNGKTSWPEAVEQLANIAGIPMPYDRFDTIYKANKTLAEAYSKSIKGKVYEYLKSRGLDDEDIHAWLLGFDGKKITFPLYDKYKNILGFSKRWLIQPEGSNDKYRNPYNSDVFNKGYYMYGIHLLDMDFPEIRITEGPMDVIMPKKYGVKNIVATQGTAFTDGHVEIIKNLGLTPVFCHDADKAGVNATKSAINKLSEKNIYCKILILPDGMDMADMANEYKWNIEQYIQDNAMTYGYYKIRNIISQYDTKVNETKVKLYPEIIKLMKEIPEVEKPIIKDFIKSRMQLDI